MASQPQRSLPGANAGGGGAGGGGAGRDKRRSFLPAPTRASGIPTPSSSIPTPSFSPASQTHSLSLKTHPPEVPKENPPREVIPGAEKLRVGQRVLISGVKPGTLRFVGRTHIAPGFWCGVELFDASGLHDGEVDGKRYFNCKPFRGIFAPVDKVVPDESSPAAPSSTEEKRRTAADYPRYSEYLERSGKSDGGKFESGKIPGSGRYQSSRHSGSGSARGGPEGLEKDELKSAPGEGAYTVSAFNRRSYGGQDTPAGYYKTRVKSMYADSPETSRSMSSEEGEGYSRHIKEHLQSDSRHYFNLTFGRDTPPLPPPPSNLPDLLSSVSPPSPLEPPVEPSLGQHLQSAYVGDEGPCHVSDIQLGFKDGEEDGVMGKGAPSTSESDASLSGHSSTFEDTSVITVNEVVRGERKPVGKDGKVIEPSHAPRSSAGRQNADQAAVLEDDGLGSVGRKDRAGGGARGTGEVHEDGSNEVSPEVSQVLEWDYDHDAFDGSSAETMKVPGVGGDLNLKDAGRLADRHSLGKADYDEDSEESEEEDDDDEEEEDEEETSEEETTSEEEEDEEDEEEEEESSEEESEEEESEDDRIEADRNAPNARGPAVAKGANDGRVAAPAVSSSEVQGMTNSAVVTSEMTESSDTVRVSQNKENTTSSDAALSKSQSEASQKPDQPGKKSRSGSSSQKPKKKKSTPNSAEDKKIVAQHKKAVKSASSRLADYIKAPLPPPKPKEKEAGEPKSSKKGKVKKDKTSVKAGKKQNKAKGQDKTKEENKEGEEEKKKERRQPRVREEKPKVQRTVVKSKWGNIMSQIEANKTTVKIKPKAEIQSSLAAYLSTPVPPNPKRDSVTPEATSPEQNKEAPKAKPKPKLIKHPKPDFSNIKSKLNITPPPPPPRKDNNANTGNVKSPGPNNLKNSLGKPAEARTRNNVARKPPVPKFNAKEHLEKNQESPEKETGQSQSTGSCASLTAVDGNAVSRAGARLRSDRASSATSTKSDNSSAAQRSVKSMNQRNAQQSGTSEQQQQQQDRKNVVKSTIPPAAPRKASASTSGEAKKGAEGEAGGAGSGVKAPSVSPPRVTGPSKPVWGSGSGSGGTRQGSGVTGKGTGDHTRSRTKGGGGSGPGPGPGLKSGHPPDVVSTSARGARAQEVARLESLCEARTKELHQANMQLRDSLRAFDAVVCLLNYCTKELDAFSCPRISAKLKATTNQLTEQQQHFDQLSQEKSQVDARLQEALAAKEAALQEAQRLKEEARQAEEAHSAAQQKLQEEQTAALKSLKEEITTQHQETMQQMQKYQENQTEYTRQSHKRQLVELTSEHQMATNQLKVAHLEEIQELRNKHELQVEELHAQHRKKLEDITDRFESIKLSLTEKVQSLCTECDDLRVRAKTSEEALQRDADVKVQLALTPYLHLPKEIESLKTVIDMRTEEIQKLRRQNMDLVKQLEELPIVQEKVVALQQKVENLQAIINIKTDHEKQLHEKCQVLMRKYDRESRANKRLSMDYEQVVWRMSQSADFTGSTESISPRQLSRSPSRGSQTHSHGSSPVRSLSSSSQGGADGTNGTAVVRRQRKTSAGEEPSGDSRRRANTLSSDTPRHRRGKGEGDGVGINGPGGSGSSSSSRKRHGLSKSGDYSELVTTTTSSPSATTTTKDHEDSFSSGHDSGDTSDFFSMESNVILETAQGVSFQLMDKTISADGCAPAAPTSQDEEVFMEELVLHPIQDVSPEEVSSPSQDTDTQTHVTVVVTSPSSQ